MSDVVAHSYHLPYCRDCNELCMAMMCTEEQYVAWWTRHESHAVEHGPEIPVGGVYGRHLSDTTTPDYLYPKPTG